LLAFYQAEYHELNDAEQQIFAQFLLLEDPEIMEILRSPSLLNGVIGRLKRFKLPV
tara:strand:- start:130 stop:297 length:168 start_codon:yes stop_codon:yes gene_type:complete